MCGRFTQRLSSGEIAQVFDAVDLAETTGGAFNVAPTQDVAAVLERRVQEPEVEPSSAASKPTTPAPEPPVERVVERLRWGLVPPWSDGPDPRGRLINARAETVATSPAFRSSFRSKRCIVPADGFYEWQATGGPRKRPMYITREDGSPLALAGLWSAWKDPATGLWLRTCTIITTTPNDLLAPIHDRMPVILPRDAWDRWLERDTDPGELGSLLRPWDGAHGAGAHGPASHGPAGERTAEPDLVAWEVAPLVNNPRSQGAELIAPVGDLGL